MSGGVTIVAEQCAAAAAAIAAWRPLDVFRHANNITRFAKATIAYIANQLASGGLKPEPVSVASGVLGKRPRDIRATLPPLVAPLAAITGVSLPTAELLATMFETASKLMAAAEKEIADTKMKSGRHVGGVVAKRVKECFQ